MNIAKALPHLMDSKLPSAKHEKARWSCSQCKAAFIRRVRDILNSPEEELLCTSCGAIKRLSKRFVACDKELITYWSPLNEALPEKVTISERVQTFLWLCQRCKSTFTKTPRSFYSGSRLCDNCLGNRQVSMPSKLREHWDTTKNGPLLELVSPYSDNRRYHWHCDHCSESFVGTLRTQLSKASFRCRSCIAKKSASQRKVRKASRSKGEIELEKYCSTIVQEPYVTNKQPIRGAGELDIYFPALRKAIEFNGDYWHSDNRAKELGFASSEERHSKKLHNARAAQVELAFVWEHDWRKHRAVIEKAVTAFLLTSEVSPLLKRRTSIKDVYDCSLCML